MPILFDSSLYIASLRTGRDAVRPLLRWWDKAPVWLSSVVMGELYAGAENDQLRILEKMERDFVNARRILVPSFADWTEAGRVLSRVARKYGYETIGRTRLTNDALIATSAARTGITIITANNGDFGRLAEFCLLKWQIEA